MTLVIALLGAVVLLSVLVLLAGYRGRGGNHSDRSRAADSGRPLDGHGSAVTSNKWTFGGGGGLA
jgi:hypothetical protein